MANAVPKLKKLIKEGKVAVGTWAQMASAEAVEMVGSAYFDFVVIDTEHGHFGLDTALHMVRAARRPAERRPSFAYPRRIRLSS